MEENITNKIVLVFGGVDAENVTLTLYDQKADLTAETVANVMVELAAMNVLQDANGVALTDAVSAKTVKEVETPLF